MTNPTTIPTLTLTVESPIGTRTSTWIGRAVKQGRYWAQYWRSLGYAVTES